MRRASKITCTMNEALKDELVALSRREDRSLSWLLEQAVAYWLSRRVRGRPPGARLPVETAEPDGLGDVP